MQSLLTQLAHIDDQIFAVLSVENGNAEEMARLLDERKACLKEISLFPVPPEKEAWASALSRTERLLTLIKSHREQAAAQASHYMKGRKSVQIYKNFE